MTLSTDEFMRRFLMHVLPSGFLEVRSARPFRQGFLDVCGKVRSSMAKGLGLPRCAIYSKGTSSMASCRAPRTAIDTALSFSQAVVEPNRISCRVFHFRWWVGGVSSGAVSPQSSSSLKTTAVFYSCKTFRVVVLPWVPLGGVVVKDEKES